MAKGSIWSGLALIVAGGIFIWASNGAGRSSRLGLIVGGAIILMGVVRMVLGRRGAPPTV